MDRPFTRTTCRESPVSDLRFEISNLRFEISDLRSENAIGISLGRIPDLLLASMVALLTVAAGLVGDRAQDVGGRVSLLKGEPFDRITVTDGAVVEIEPVSPRPLPEPDKEKKDKAEKAKRKKAQRRAGPAAPNVGPDGRV